jgi:hypothetical protein
MFDTHPVTKQCANSSLETESMHYELTAETTLTMNGAY